MNPYSVCSYLIDTARVIPDRWRLPLRYRALLSSRGAEPELRHLFTLCKNHRCALDIGANHGFYAYKMAQRFERVFAFEPNTAFDADIRYYHKKNLTLLPYGLSDVNQQLDLHIPRRNGVAYPGWASVERRNLDFASSWETVSIRLQRLDDQLFAAQYPIDLIKIDVEGHEYNVLLGGAQTIQRNKPVLILEDNPQKVESIQALLGSWGYRKVLLTELLQREAPSPNSIYLPTGWTNLPV